MKTLYPRILVGKAAPTASRLDRVAAVVYLLRLPQNIFGGFEQSD